MHPTRFTEGNSHVLDEMINEKTGGHVARDGPRGEIGERPTARRAAADRREYVVEVETGPIGVEQGFADSHHVARYQHLVHHLGMLTGAVIALSHDGGAQHGEARTDRVEDFARTTDHDREGGVP